MIDLTTLKALRSMKLPEKNAIQRRICEAKFSESQTSVEAIEYHEDRELDQTLINKLATCAYIRDNHHIVLKGATGAGKSYLANALEIAACRKLYKVRYVRMPGLLNEYAIAKSMNTQGKVKKILCQVRSPGH